MAPMKPGYQAPPLQGPLRGFLLSNAEWPVAVAGGRDNDEQAQGSGHAGMAIFRGDRRPAGDSVLWKDAGDTPFPKDV